VDCAGDDTAGHCFTLCICEWSFRKCNPFSLLTYSFLGCRPFLSRLHRALPSGAVAPGTGLHHLLRRHHPEAIPPPGGLPHPQGSSLGAEGRGPAQVSGHHGLRRHLLHGRLHGLVAGPPGKRPAGEPPGGGHEHLPSAQVGAGHADQRDAHPVLRTAPVHRQPECQHPVPGKRWSSAPLNIKNNWFS